ncbi:ABC transporter transmembrane domain-containing protein [Tessaracoccus flavescens]|uniref:ABC transporter n=1 Tax=Tessaracoccus flavescens TaxID=399497 RepID=A0A1Q2CXX7_9ACTN|nr:ABC transporter ATP-binding protein [Tessaracoccus flavescens]AQP50891.1 ABC transporter [Tessaracoccus flavescens]
MHAAPRGRYDFPPAITADSRPDVTSPSRFLFWLIRSYGWVVPAMTLSAATWLIPAAFTPWLLGRAIDTGIEHGIAGALGWVLGLLGVIVIGVMGGIAFHTFAVRMWLLGIYGIQRRVSRQSVHLGHVLNRRVPTGEVLSVSSSDSDQFGATIESFGHAIAAAISFLLASVLMLTTSPTLGIVVLVAVPLLVAASTPVLRPLTRAQEAERTESSSLTSLATDIATGLRILRGVGGERTFAANYERQSQKVRRLGVRLGTWQAVVEAISILLSGLLLVALVYLGSLRLLEGTLSVGELISFFGYAVFLISPMQTFFDFAQKWVQGLVAASKTMALLGADVPWAPASQTLGAAPVLHDEASGVSVRPGRMLGVVSADPDASAALADRLGRYLPEAVSATADDEDLSGRAKRRARRERLADRRRRAEEDAEAAARPWGVTADGVDYSVLDIEDLRERVVVSHTGAMLFAGTLQSAVDPWGTHSRTDAEEALRVASAEDIYASLPEGWQGRIDEKGRGLSGGQRQRLILARSLLLDPDVLVLVEPTSAVDAHTEARISERLAAHRAGRTTVVVTASPLLLRRCDEIAVLVDGREVARGTHDELHDNPDYRGVIARGMEDSP